MDKSKIKSSGAGEPEPIPTGKINKREITTELRDSYLDYAMSVIVGRALPDVRDGMKPVHRRILWSMWDSGLTSSAKLRKSANVVGEVLGRYHPHGDQSVYDAMARMTRGDVGLGPGPSRTRSMSGSRLIQQSARTARARL